MTYWMYLITRTNGTISGVNQTLFRTIRDAEREAAAEFIFENSAYNYITEKVVEMSDEVTYNVYEKDYYTKGRGQLRYIIHIIKMVA